VNTADINLALLELIDRALGPKIQSEDAKSERLRIAQRVRAQILVRGHSDRRSKSKMNSALARSKKKVSLRNLTKRSKPFLCSLRIRCNAPRLDMFWLEFDDAVLRFTAYRFNYE
jgi:hypothetical protein